MAKTKKKDNPIVGGIILLVLGVLAVIFGKDYVWVLFNTIEIPLQIAGAVFGGIGVISLLIGISEKKKAADKKEEVTAE